jgi:hypothetical protein
MIAFIYTWYLLTTPIDRDVCSLWINHIATPADLAAACPPIGDLTAYRLRIAWSDTGAIACDDIPGEYIYEAHLHCRGMMMWDLYTITIYQPDVISVVCTLTLDHDGQPTAAEIADQCQQAPAAYQLRFVSKTAPEPAPAQCIPPAPQPGLGLLDGADSPDQITTSDDLYQLAGHLLWHGLATPHCNGWSGIDPDTGYATPCGMDSARSAVIAWQNRYDTEIITASAKWNVPPRLLKHLAIIETQMWPWTGTHGEIGMTQITDDGIDTLLYFYSPGYSRLTPDQRRTARAQIRASMDCINCSALQAAESARDDWDTYAAALAAYYCAHGDWTDALVAWNVKHEISNW